MKALQTEMDRINDRLIVNLIAQRKLLLDMLRTILAFPQTVTVESIKRVIEEVGEEP